MEFEETVWIEKQWGWDMKQWQEVTETMAEERLQ
jgi:hypothetical protein